MSDKKADENKFVKDWPRPEMEEITEKEQKAVDELWDRLLRKPEPKEGDFLPPESVLKLSEEDQRIMCYKFCMARKFKVADAEKMARNTWKYKTEKNCYTQNYFPAIFPLQGWDQDELNKHFGLENRTPDRNDRIYKTLIKSHQVIFHKTDNRGHPLLIERTGGINSKSIVSGMGSVANIGEAPWVPCVDYHVYFNEVGGKLIEYQDQTLGKQEGRRILGFTAILDCNGLGFGHMHNPALDILKKVWACDADYYPEVLHKCFVVNTPSSVEFLYRIVKGWIDPRVRAKLHFVTPDKTKETLLECIPAENLPDFLGGTCTWPLPMDADGHPEDDADEVKTEEVKVTAGKVTTREFNLKKGEELTWEFEAQQIQFSVDFIPADNITPSAATPSGESESSTTSPGESRDESTAPTGGAKPQPGQPISVVAKNKSTGGASNYVAPCEGRLVVSFDNSFSWFKAKNLRMRFIKL